MNLNIYLEDSLAASLNQATKESKQSRDAIIREAIQEWLMRHQKKRWPRAVLDFNGDDARETAMLRAVLKQQGNPIGAYDILLAGSAPSRKLIMVTSNTKEFSRIEGLTLEDWRQT